MNGPGAEGGELDFQGEADDVKTRKLEGTQAGLMGAVALSFSLFHLYTAGAGAFPNLVQRSIHLGFALALCFALYPAGKSAAAKGRIPLYDLFLMGLAVASCIYVVINYTRIIENPAEHQGLDLFFGALLTILILESARRTIGWLFPSLAAFSLIYAYLGPYFPGDWGHRGFGLSFMLETLYLSTTGIWGLVVGISATVIAIFIIFGALILYTGGGQSFMEFSVWIAGRSPGGAAKVATVASSMFGMISGSAVANVATTGSFTIPMMKRLGYRPEFAGAVESTASSAGQITPPIMGAGAFLMAEFLGIPYLKVLKAAIVPALLFYTGVILAIHFEAKRVGLLRVPEEQIPSLKRIVHPSRSAPLLIPIVVLVYFLFRGYTPTMAAFWSTVSASALFVASGGGGELKARLGGLLGGLRSAARGLVMVATLVACAQIIISMVSLTGLGIKISQMLIGVSGGSFVLALVLSAMVSLVLGMGIPTTAAYILAASVVGPVLISLNIQPLAAHLFLFYFAILSAITPPVCAAVFVGSGIAHADWLRTAYTAMRLASVTYIVPFMFVHSGSLLLMGDLKGIVFSIGSAVIGVALISGGAMGYFIRRLHPVERLLMVAAAILLLKPGLYTDLAGSAMAAAVILWQLRQKGEVRGKDPDDALKGGSITA